jgi:hypothetical protein
MLASCGYNALKASEVFNPKITQIRACGDSRFEWCLATPSHVRPSSDRTEKAPIRVGPVKPAPFVRKTFVHGVFGRSNQETDLKVFKKVNLYFLRSQLAIASTETSPKSLKKIQSLYIQTIFTPT